MSTREIIKSLFLPGRRTRDINMRNLCIAVLFCLLLYAVSTFPEWYNEGLTSTEIVGIALTMLAVIVVFYLERRYSSRSMAHEPDWSTAAGTMRAFSFDKRVCRTCGKRRILAEHSKGDVPQFVAPGLPTSTKNDLAFYCISCKNFAAATETDRSPYESGHVGYKFNAAHGYEIASANKYVIDVEYQKRYFIISLIILAGLVSSIYFSRNGFMWLVLPLISGYFFFVCIITVISNLITAYYVCSDSVIVRGIWGATQYSAEDAIALVKFSNSKSADEMYGLYTKKENLAISPIVNNSENLICEIRAFCEKNNIPIIE